MTLEEAEYFSPLIPAKSLATDFDSTDFETNDTNAGSYFIPPDPHGAAGPNHVVPTSRTARFSSPLGVYDFQKRSSLIMASASGAAALAGTASALARGEGLTAHARSAEYRGDADAS